MGKGAFCCSREEDPKPIKYEENRKCTDVLFLLLFAGFWIGFIAVASVGFANGDPDRLLYGTDYLGFVCGKGDGPKDFSVRNTRWQSSIWSKNTFLWFPLPANGSANSIQDLMSQGICVEQCPFIDNNTLAALEESSMNFWALNETVLDDIKVFTYGYESRTGDITFAPDYFFVPYNSGDFYRRCIPKGLQPAALNATLQDVPGATRTTEFFFRGILEIGACWRVFLISCFIALFLCYLYVFFMRLFVRPIVYTVLLLVFAGIIVIAYMMFHRSEQLRNEFEAQPEPRDAEQERYVKFWEISSYIVWASAALYVILIIWFWKRIKEACAMIEIAGRVVSSSPLMLLIPPVVSIAVILLAVWCIFVAVYLYTADNYEKGRERLVLMDINQTLPAGLGTVTIDNQTYANTTGGVLDSDNAKRNLLFYDLFGFLWTMGFINAIGFTLIAFCGVFWYFSDVDSDKKEIPPGSICKATVWCLFYHLGTLALGSLLVAIVQFSRFLLKYFAKQCEAIGKSDVLKCIICMADCFLACFERIIKIISKNAYIMMCITSDNFFFSARDAFNIILDNVVTLSILSFIVEFVMLLGKALVIIGVLLLAYLMMDDPTLAPNVETRILPMIVLGFIVYFICCVFFNVYNTTVDTIFICYHHDIKINMCKDAMYVPKELHDQINGYKEKLERLQKARDVELQAKSTEPVPTKPSK